jgi:hypothetical protein
MKDNDPHWSTSPVDATMSALVNVIDGGTHEVTSRSYLAENAPGTSINTTAFPDNGVASNDDPGGTFTRGKEMYTSPAQANLKRWTQ